MVGNIFEIGVILVGLGLLIWAIRSIARQGELGSVRDLVGRRYELPTKK